MDPLTEYLFIAKSFDKNVTMVPLNSANGALISASSTSYAAGTGPVDVKVDPTGQYVYMVSEYSDLIHAWEIDRTNKILTVVSGSPFDTGGEPFAIEISKEVN